MFVGLLKETYKIYKTIVFCKKTEIEEVQLLLLLKGIEATVIDEELSEEGMRNREEAWVLSEGGQYTGMAINFFIKKYFVLITSCVSFPS